MNNTHKTIAMRALDWLQFLPHIKTICGQSRRGGIRTSNSRRRSNMLFGRVAVTHVQGSPKGGGALGLLRVLNTRLGSVPPLKMKEEPVRRLAQRISSTLLTVAIVVGPASAQTQTQIEKRYSRDYTECMDASGGVTADMMDCLGVEIDRQDARLNQAYVMVMGPLPKPRKDKLRGLQRTWIKQRDAKCARASAEAGGGTLSTIIYSSCILDETISRTIFLENYKG